MSSNKRRNKAEVVGTPMSGKAVNPRGRTGTDAGAHATDRDASSGFPVVGIGASAGGLTAFEEFFSAMPAKTESGMALVIVQHLSPDHKSILTELVKRCTSMEVFEVADGMEVKPNCTYIIPPNHDMAILNGRLQLLEPSAPRGTRMPIDFFFRSLAQDQHERAICIVLSGTGSDGTLGVREVKGEGGVAFAQDPNTTQYIGMPSSAIATGLVDAVLPPAEMPSRLIAYVSRVFGRQGVVAEPAIPKLEDILQKICLLLRSQTGHDFSQYKQNTLVRRVERRMALASIERPDDYLRYLQQNVPEVEALFRDLLICVTNFFRDPEAFAVLEREVIPRLLEAKTPGGDVRVWICGCSTGEEAFSIAMLMQECLDKKRVNCKVQIFATDIDRRAVEQARTGVFPTSIASDVSAERLARFFTSQKEDNTFVINKAVRDMIIFSEQDVIKDPPFSRLDLISCRNLLIYMSPELQKKVIPLFHYSLTATGILFLGPSETVGDFSNLFSTVDRKWRIYRRREDLAGAGRVGLGEFVPPLVKTQIGIRPHAPGGAERAIDFGGVIRSSLLEHYAQVGILVNGRGEMLQIFGRTGKYLEQPPGEVGVNVLALARAGLKHELTTALHRAVHEKKPVFYRKLWVKTNGGTITASLCVRPACNDAGEMLPNLFLIALEELPPEELVKEDEKEQITATEATNKRITELEQELRGKEQYLQTTIEELETSNEDLKSTNEEMQSVNEELQSTNEEMETSREELQSVNEELATVNAELQSKVAELSRANNDMNNLLAGTGVGTVFVDVRLNIVRFTPSATQIINLIPSDVGRPVAHLVSNLIGYDRLVDDIERVLDTLMPIEAEVSIRTGATYLMSIRPYRTLENAIEGAVLTFVDITRRKQSEERFGALLLASSDVLYRMSADWSEMLHLRSQDFLANTEKPTHDWLKKYIHPDDQADLMSVVREAIRTKSTFEMEHRVLRADGSLGWTFSRAIPILDAKRDIVEWFGAASDITERKKVQAMESVKNALGYAEAIVATVREPLLVLGRDLRVISANRSFCSTFKVSEGDTTNRYLPDLGNKQWSIPELLHLLEDILPKGTVVEDYEIEHDFEHIGKRIMSINARKLRVSKETAEATAGGEELILLAINDITEHRKAQG
ncbi:MAG: PAS domain-containing protein [Sedimentisphaerales bacterium]|nr:PAS domain-containing protein [Sedimentisphaerales bacterium]